MDIEAKAEHRRAYKRNWARKRRRAIKAVGFEEVRLDLPHRLAADLRKRKPKGVGFRQWLVVELRHKVAKDSGTELEKVNEPQPPQPQQRPNPPKGADRNKPCTCGCGRKVKDCLAEWQANVGESIGARI